MRPLLFLVWILQTGLMCAQETAVDNRVTDAGILLEKVHQLETDGRYEESRSLLLDQWDNFPEQWFDLARELVFVNEELDHPQDNLQVFREGHERGYFFFLHPQLPSCKPYLQYDAFQAIAEKDMALRDEAIKRSELTWEVQLPDNFSADKTWPAILILHGGGSSIDRAKEHWKSMLLSQYFITVYIQSYLHYDYDSYGWRKYDPRAREGLAVCYNALKAKYPIDTASISICGISAGATMAMDAFLSAVLPLKAVIAFSPSKPAEFNASLSTMGVGEDKSAMIVIGDHDSKIRLMESAEMARALDSAGLKCEMRLIPGLGHDYPSDFSSVLDHALIKAYPELARERGNQLMVYELKGTPYEVGYQHGNLLKDEIHEIIGRWEDIIAAEYQLTPEMAIKQFLEATSYNEYVLTYAPELYKEIEGIADGAGIPFDIMLAFQMGEELEVQGEALFQPKCTAIAAPVNENHPAIVSQNMDPPEFLHGFPTLLKIEYEGKNNAIMVYTVPGLIGLNGMSKNNIAVACNSISMLNSSKDGMPVAFVLRKLLECKDLEEAGQLLESLKHATPQAYTIGDKDSVICYECSANACKPYRTFEESGVVLHTNFSVLNRDFNDTYVEILAQYGKTTDDPYFCPRFYMLYDTIQEHIDHIDRNFLERVLRLEEPEISPVLNQYTYGSTIMVLGDTPGMYICAGNTRRSFVHVTFE